MEIPYNSGKNDLFDLLQEETEIKDFATDNSPEPISTDFEEIEPENKPTSEAAAPIDNKPLSKSQCVSNAKSIVDLVDGVACMALPVAYKKRIFGTKARFDLAKELVSKMKRNSNYEPTTEEIKLVDSLTDYTDYINIIELEEDEKALISKPLADVLYKHQKEASPELMLIIALGSVYLPKVLPLIFK